MNKALPTKPLASQINSQVTPLENNVGAMLRLYRIKLSQINTKQASSVSQTCNSISTSAGQPHFHFRTLITAQCQATLTDMNNVD